MNRAGMNSTEIPSPTEEPSEALEIVVSCAFFVLCCVAILTVLLINININIAVYGTASVIAAGFVLVDIAGGSLNKRAIDLFQKLKFSHRVLEKLQIFEDETKFVRNYLVENDKASVDELAKPLKKFILYCIQEFFDLDKMLNADPDFFNMVLESLFKCLKIGHPSAPEADISDYEDTNPHVKKRIIYKCLTLAFVLKQAAEIFTRTHQPKLAAKYKEHSKHYQVLATNWLECSREDSFNYTKEFLSHRACVMVAKGRWRKGYGEIEEQCYRRCIPPRASYVFHVITNIFYIALFIVIMLSRNQIEYPHKETLADANVRSTEKNQSFESKRALSEAVHYSNASSEIGITFFWEKINETWHADMSLYVFSFLFGWQTMFIAQVLLSDNGTSAGEIFLCSNFMSNIIFFCWMQILKYLHGNWYLWLIVRFFFSVSFHISFIVSAIVLLRHFTADRFLGSVSRMLLSFIIVFIVFWITYAVTILSLTGEATALVGLPWKIFENGAFEIFADLKEGMRHDKFACEIKSCDENLDKTDDQIADCLVRKWLVPISLLVYVLVSTIVLINLITSFLTSAYDELKNDSRPHADEVHYEFYRLMLPSARLNEYRKKSRFPPPFTIIPLLFYALILIFWVVVMPFTICCEIYEFCEKRRKKPQNGLGERDRLVEQIEIPVVVVVGESCWRTI